MNDKQIQYTGILQKNRESGKIPERIKVAIESLFCYNPVKASWRSGKILRSLLDLPAIPNSVSDEKIIKKIAALLSERTIKNIVDPKESEKNGKVKPKNLAEYKNPYLITIDDGIFLSKAGIDGFNNQINNAIDGREELRVRKIPEDFWKNVPKDESGKIKFTNTQQIIDFIRKEHLNSQTHTSSKIIEYKQITCHLLKEMIVQENYDQFKKDIDRATEIFENYAIEEFIYFFNFVNPNQPKPTTIQEIQGIQLKITQEQLKEEGIKYNKDIEFGLLTRSKTAESIKKKTRGNLDQSSADQLMDIGGFRQIGLKKDIEGIKQSHIIQYYIQKKINRQSYIENKHITSKIPYTLEEIEKLGYKLTEQEIELVVSQLDSIIKSKGILYARLLNAHQFNKPDIYELDYQILTELGLTDPIIIRQMELEIERTNKDREEMFYKKQENRIEAKKRLVQEMKPKEYLGITTSQKEIDDIIFWYISNHKEIIKRKIKHPRIDGTKDMKIEIDNETVVCTYINKKGGQEKIIFPKNKINELVNLRLEKRTERESQGKGNEKTAGARTKNGQISDLKSGRMVYTKNGQYFKGEIQTYIDEDENDPYSDDLIYQIIKDISPHAERDIFITESDIKNYIHKKIIGQLSKSVNGQELLERIAKDKNNKYVKYPESPLEKKLYEYIVNKFGLEYNEQYDIYQIREQKNRIEKMKSGID